MVRAVIFDIYGVLVQNGWQDFKQRHFADRPGDWEKLRALGKRVDSGDASYQEMVIAIAAATDVTETEVKKQLEVNEINRELLGYIRSNLARKYKLGILSNASRDIVTELFSPEERKMFSAVVLSVNESVTKPNQASFLLAAERLGVRPEECLMVDDQAGHLAAAAGIGMEVIRFTTVKALKKSIADKESRWQLKR